MTQVSRYAPRCLGLLIALASPAIGRAQGTPAGLDPATAAIIAPIVEQAKATHLPVEFLYVKAREGQVRRAPLAAIASAVRALAQRLRSASEALAPTPSDEELRAAADAMHQGVPVETLREMRRAGGDGSLVVPLGVLTQLVARGVPVEKASLRIVDLLERGAVPRNFIALEESVREDVMLGKRPEESLDLRLKGIFPNLPQPGTNADAGGLQANTPKRPR